MKNINRYWFFILAALAAAIAVVAYYPSKNNTTVPLGSVDDLVGEDVFNMTFIEYDHGSRSKFMKSANRTFGDIQTVYQGSKYRFGMSESVCDSITGCDHYIVFNGVAPEKPGLYWAVGEYKGGDYAYPVAVMSKHGEPAACLLITSFTSQAYSDEGGVSFYKPPYDAPVAVSLRRPLTTYASIHHGYAFPGYELYKQSRVDLNVFDDRFLHENPELLSSR